MGITTIATFIANVLGTNVPDDGNVAALVTQFELALQTYIGRRRLTANTDYYVAIGGDNGNPGTQLLPWATLQHAWDFIQNSLDPGPWTITVHVGPGTYQPFQASGSVAGAPPSAIVFTGDITTPSNCKITATNTSAVIAGSGGQLTVQGFEVAATGTGTAQGFGVLATSGGQLLINFMRFGVCAVSGIGSESGVVGFAVPGGASSIVANSVSFINSGGSGGVIDLKGATITLVGTPSFTNFAPCFNQGSMNLGSVTWVGAAGAGIQYTATGNAVISTNGAPTNWPTGLSAGTTTTGGQIV
jgi:hypothetical protein